MPAHYAATSAKFVVESIESIIGQLTSKGAEAGFFQQLHTQTVAWRSQIQLLQRTFHSLIARGELLDAYVLLEFPIPRRAKRIDAVIVSSGIIFVLEFKCGADSFSRADVEQVEDYCLDLRDFHHPSQGRTIVPILVATHADEKSLPEMVVSSGVSNWIAATPSLLEERITLLANTFGCSCIDAEAWNQGEYVPTPTIIEAARHLYAGNNVGEISRCHAGAENLTKTSDAVLNAIQQARAERRKLICFVTGVPGAGKTLTGLNVVHNQKLHDGDLGAFLSGNGPLVKVLNEALARDHYLRSKTGDDDTRSKNRIAESRRQVSTFIHNVHRFIDAYWNNHDIPKDKVVVFDEAQRAWNRAQSERKFNRPFSEPEMLLRIMDRHQDWSVIVALVGGGQEINTGEAGLSEWGRTLVNKFPEWKVVASPLLASGRYQDTDGLFESSDKVANLVENQHLHLATSLRSYRADGLSKWVSLLLQHDENAAGNCCEQLGDYPLVMTRSLTDARKWLRARQRGSRRAGIIASSGARRLRADGLDLSAKIEVEHWFLNPHGDVRSSQCLETAATEFDIQGLEIDWACLAWGGDLIPSANGWEFRQFKGTKWLRVNDPTRQQFILNKYRVLLTRAREGLIIYVPIGNPNDETRPMDRYERVADYCQRCGIETLGTSNDSSS